MFGPSASLSSGRASARRWPPVSLAAGFNPHIHHPQAG
jgi:hypothetical protein